ncbi:MAG TPA: [Fe-S]-binding protein [Candidatus Ozemobacteraceae bacterium]|nr:[Fe-S]-binding protein [Candidatus Ozemobacteraceae bacterium]
MSRLFRGKAPAAVFIGITGLLSFAAWKARIPLLLADRFLPGAGILEILLLASYGTWIHSLLQDPRRAPAIRGRIWGLFSAVFFAQLALGLAGFERFLMTGALHLPVPALIVGGPLYRGEGLFMPILYGTTLLLAGSAWCSHLCYIGAWDHACAGSNNATRREYPAAAPWFRLITLTATVGLALGLRWIGAARETAFAAAVTFSLGGIAVMLVLSRRMGRMMHCTAYCPIGLLSTVLGRLNPFRIRIAPTCDACGACSRSCRYGALDPEHLRRQDPGQTCTLCGDCLAACARGNLGYAFPGLDRERARSLFLVIVVILHTVFLGVARI